MLVVEKQPAFLDFQIRTAGFIGAKESKALREDDIIMDDQGIPGIIRFKSEQYGNFIEFIDGYSVYDTQLKSKLKLMTLQNDQLFLSQSRRFGYIVSLARVIKESLEDDFPYVNIIHNGREVFVRGSNNRTVTKKYTQSRVNNSTSFLSIKLTPFYNMEVETFDIARQKRYSKFSYIVLRNMFIDIDLKQREDNRLNVIINDENEYNEEIWNEMARKFRKYHIKYERI